MNATHVWEWLKALPFGSEVRRYTPPEPYITYRRRIRTVMYCVIVACVFEILPRAPIAVRIGMLTALAAAIGLWIAASVQYVLAWDELQRRALAESGAVAAAIWYVALPLIRRHYES